MKKGNIIQFVNFITDLEVEEFVVKWEAYARESMPGATPMFLQLLTEKGRYKYVSQHECREDDFHFAFKKGRNSDHFPNRKQESSRPEVIRRFRWGIGIPTKMVILP